MFNIFRKKETFNVFDELPYVCNNCHKAFPKEAKVCSSCGKELELMDNSKDRLKNDKVQYGDRNGKEISHPVFNRDTNSVELHIRGEKYPMRGFPRHHVLHGPMAMLKRYVKNLVIEQLVKCVPYKIPDENLVPPVRELARVFDLLIRAEDEPEMKRLMGQFKDAITMILQEDDAWRYRLQWAAEKLDINKFKLSNADKYYFKAKSFKIDTK